MRKLLEAFFQCYLKERNLEKTLGFVTDQVISIGTGVHEVARSKAELCRLMECEFKEIPVPMQFWVYNYKEYMLQDIVCNVYANVYVKLEYQEILSEMHTRISCTWVKQDESWKISMIHMSTPTEEQEAEMFFPLHYGTDVVEKLSIDSGAKLLELVSKTLPGGIMGGYLEPGFPLYIINDKMLEILDYTYEELITETNEKMLNIIYEEDREMAETVLWNSWRGGMNTR